MKRATLFAVAIGFIILALLVFPVSKIGGFASDDWDWLTAAAKHTSIVPDLMTNDTGGRSGGSYDPLSSLWVHILYRNFGINPAPYHIASIALHALNAFLLALLIAQLMRLFFSHARTQNISLGSGILFLLWPTHVEAVQWIAAVPHLLATFFILLTLYNYLSWRMRKTRFGFTLTVLMSIGAFLSKETSLILPILLLCMEIWYQKYHLKSVQLSNYLRLGSIFLVALIYLVLRFEATGILLGSYAEQHIVFRPWQWLNSFLTFFEEFFTLGTGRVPWMYWYWHYPAVMGLCGIAVIGSIWLGIVRSRKSELVVSWHLLLLSLLPFITLGFNRLSQEGERYTYLPSVFFLLFANIVMHRYMHHFKMVLYILVLIATLQPLSYRNHAWQEAFRVADAIKMQVSALPHLNDPEHLYIFVGLPDTISGAHVFRNNIVQAAELLAPAPAATIVALPIYTQFQASEANAALLHWTSDARGLYARNQNHKLVVTGFDRRETEFLIYELWNYNYSFFSSDTIRLLFNASLQRKITEGSASIITWDQGMLRDVTQVSPEPSSL